MSDQQPHEFTFDTRDEYNRRHIAEKLIKLLESPIPISPLVIDGRWGCGKSEFCFKTKNLIDADPEKKFQSAYIDAFKEDHADEPLASLLAAVLSLVPDENAGNDLIKRAIPVLRFGLKTAINAGLHWVIRKNSDELAGELSEAIKSAGSEAVNQSVEMLLRDHQHSDSNMDALRAALTEIASTRPMVIFIDELDRCRPDFAVAILERIKHIFNVPNVQFVLMANLHQLEQSIIHLYGGDQSSASRYLDKFIGYRFSLPSSKPQVQKVQIAHACQHFTAYCRQSPLLPDSVFCGDNAIAGFARELISRRSLSLREVETFCRALETLAVVAKDAWPETMLDGYGILFLFSAGLHCFNSTITQEILHGHVDLPAIKLWLIISDAEYRDKPIGRSSYVQAPLMMLVLESLSDRTSQSAKWKFIRITGSVDTEYWAPRLGYLWQPRTPPVSYMQIVTDVLRRLRLEEVD